MEKIQSAIEKARAARADVPRATEAAAQQPVAAGAEPAPSVQPAVEAAWAALAPYHPDMARMRRNRIVTLFGGKEAVPFDMMRTKVIQQMRANGWKRLGITSPTASCGKSTVALNLAFSLARQTELRTVLAELDLRRPSMANILGLKGKGQVGFARVLEGRATLAETALRYGEGLALANCDGPARNPAELLHSSTVTAALGAIEVQYAPDLTLFDMSPMLVSDDVMAFVPHIDAVLLIAAAEATTIKEIDSCERELASQTNVMGVVLNKCNYMGREYGYNYYG